MVQTKGLTKKFWDRGRRITILNKINFDVKRGQIFAIIGPNASGKTTLLKVLSTIFLPDGGSAKIMGYDLVKQSKKVRSVSSFTSPALTFQKKLTLREVLKFYSGAIKKDFEAVIPFLNECGLYKFLDESVEVFSEGQKMLTRIAIALLKDPQVLMLDEPTAPLDTQKKEFLIKFLRKYAEDRALLIVDHNPDTIGQLCTDFLLLARGGKVVKKGTMDEFFSGFPYKFALVIRPRGYLPTNVLNGLGKPYQKNPDGTISILMNEREEAETMANTLMKEHNRLIASFETSIVTWREVYNYWLEQTTK
jgi:ABC-2 type transport system ATP-binding protein